MHFSASYAGCALTRGSTRQHFVHTRLKALKFRLDILHDTFHLQLDGQVKGQ